MILGINNFNILKPNRKTVQANRLSYAQQVNLNSPIKDTFSFRGLENIMPPKENERRFSPSISTCEDVYTCAEPARYYLENVLNKYLSPLKMENEQSNERKFPVFSLITRAKEPLSIKEKVSSRFYRFYNSESEQYARHIKEGFDSNFKRNPNITDDVIDDTINRITGLVGTPQIMSPYNDIEFYFNAIVDFIDSQGYYDFSSVDEKKKSAIFNDLIEKLHDSAPNDTKVNDNFVNPFTPKGIKFYAQDIVGARIIMNEAEPQYAGEVIEALKNAVLDGKLKITSIENNVPDESKLPKGKTVSDYAYASDQQLKALAKVAGAKLDTKKSVSGYIAIHINLDLTDPIFGKYGEDYDGFGGEIQIIGKNVEYLKELEDLCYKLKSGKKLADPDLGSFRDNFIKFYVNASPEVKKAFEDYTYAAYLHQRDMSPGKQNRTFLRPTAAGLGNILPTELDFNYLKTIKGSVDYKKQAKAKSKSNQPIILTSNVKRQINREQEIKTIKKDIAYQMKHNG